MIGAELPTPIYGRGLIQALESVYFENWLAFIAPEPWMMLKNAFPSTPKAAVLPESMEQSVLENQISSLPHTKCVFGIGGGSAADAAKMYAFMRGAKLVQIPTILSVDAPFTRAIGIRKEHRVRYIGDVMPDYLLVDYEILQRAPKKLNRAGIGDILSIFTALYDWKLAHDVIDERYDPDVASKSDALFQHMIQGAEDIRQCTEKGLRLIGDLYAAEVEICEYFGNSRPEEGSEHYFAYCAEYVTRRPYIHGELVALGVLLTGLYQDRDVKELASWLDEVQVQYRPDQVGITLEEIKRTLLELPAYLDHEKQLPYGIYHHKGMDEGKANALLKEFEFLI